MLGCPLLALETLANCLQSFLSFLFCSILQPGGSSQSALLMHRQELEGSPSLAARFALSVLIPPPPLPITCCKPEWRFNTWRLRPTPLLHSTESGPGHPRIPGPCLPSPAASSPACFTKHRAPRPSSWQTARAGQHRLAAQLPLPGSRHRGSERASPW